MKFNNPNGNTCIIIDIVYVNICDCLFQLQIWKKKYGKKDHSHGHKFYLYNHERLKIVLQSIHKNLSHESEQMPSLR